MKRVRSEREKKAVTRQPKRSCAVALCVARFGGKGRVCERGYRSERKRKTYCRKELCLGIREITARLRLLNTVCVLCVLVRM